MSTFEIDVIWKPSKETGGDELAYSCGQLGIRVDNLWLTTFTTDRGDHGDHLELPCYLFAEWIADNWWALLNEPRKTQEIDDDPGFRGRHWFGAARDGFALPDAWVVAASKESIRIDARAAEFPYSRLRILTDARAVVPRHLVERSLRGFICQTLEQLDQAGLTETHLSNLWKTIESTSDDEYEFCELLGALGVSPYEADDEVSEKIFEIVKDLPPAIVDDLCFACTELDLTEAARDASDALKEIANEPAIDIGVLQKDPWAEDDGHSMPWEPGIDAAHRIRAKYEVPSDDPHGCQRIFDSFGLDEIVHRDGFYDIEEPVLNGAIEVEDGQMHARLFQIQHTSRRFDAARSLYLAVQSARPASRMITRARVRDQQASRAFAAELLAPADYIRRRVSNEVMSSYRAYEIAQELDASATVVKYQARNNYIDVIG